MLLSLSLFIAAQEVLLTLLCTIVYI